MISVTEPAQAKIRAVSSEEDAAVRLSVVRGPHGCVHGWNLSVADQPGADDVVTTAGEVRVLVEKDLTPLVEGATIDYREDTSGIGFVIEAPNAGHGHGHGQSQGQGGCGHH